MNIDTESTVWHTVMKAMQVREEQALRQLKNPLCDDRTTVLLRGELKALDWLQALPVMPEDEFKALLKSTAD